MSSTRAYIVGIVFLISAVLAALYFVVGVPRVYKETFLTELPSLHRYGDAKQSIKEIHVQVFYFLPQNKRDAFVADWRSLLDAHFQKLQEFHNYQFQGRSRISYAIYPEPVVGRSENNVYDTDITQHGNPEALRRVVSELEERGLVRQEPSMYQVLFIMYEGVGAAGSENVAFLSRAFLTETPYQDFSTTFLAHEFYHTLGLPDRYTTSVKVYADGQETLLEVLASEDMMGRIRVPLEYTYIDRSTLREIGL